MFIGSAKSCLHRRAPTPVHSKRHCCCCRNCGPGCQHPSYLAATAVQDVNINSIPAFVRRNNCTCPICAGLVLSTEETLPNRSPLPPAPRSTPRGLRIPLPPAPRGRWISSEHNVLFHCAALVSRVSTFIYRCPCGELCQATSGALWMCLDM